MARGVTRDGDRIAARASAGTEYSLSTDKGTLNLAGCGSILSTTPTATPRIRISSPTNNPLASVKYAVYVFFSTSFHNFTATNNEATTRVPTKPIAVSSCSVRRFITVPPSRAADQAHAPARAAEGSSGGAPGPAARAESQ